MYSKLQACVSTSKSTISQLFNCKVGTMKGIILSPFLFVFYLNELIRLCKELPGIHIEGAIDISMLLYADDLVVIGDNVGSGRLQDYRES